VLAEPGRGQCSSQCLDESSCPEGWECGASGAPQVCVQQLVLEAGDASCTLPRRRGSHGLFALILVFSVLAWRRFAEK
jgi:hypothetical protein